MPRKVKRKGKLVSNQNTYVESMASTKDRLEEFETSFGIMQDEVQKIQTVMTDKFQQMEDSFSRLMEDVTSNRESGSSVPWGSKRTKGNKPYDMGQIGEHTNPICPNNQPERETSSEPITKPYEEIKSNVPTLIGLTNYFFIFIFVENNSSHGLVLCFLISKTW